MSIAANIKEATMLAILSRKYPIMLVGDHGTGKSAISYLVGDALGMKVVERRISQMTEGDFFGIPDRSENSLSCFYRPPDWFVDCCENPRVLFLDELNRGTRELRNAVFELADSRKLSGLYLHPETIILTACNMGENYDVGIFETAEFDRWFVVTFKPTIEEFFDYASGKVEEQKNEIREFAKRFPLRPTPPKFSDVILTFLQKNPEHLEHHGEFEPNKVFPSRRSWFRLNDVLYYPLEENVGSTAIILVADAAVGEEAALCFADFVKNYSKEISPEQILAGEFTEGRVDEMPQTQISSLIDKVTKLLVKKIEEEELLEVPEKIMKNVRKFFMMLPAELGMMMVKSIPPTGEFRGFKNVKVRERIIEIASGKYQKVSKDVLGPAKTKRTKKGKKGKK